MAYFKKIYNILTYVLTVGECPTGRTFLDSFVIDKLEKTRRLQSNSCESCILVVPPLAKFQTLTRISDVSGHWSWLLGVLQSGVLFKTLVNRKIFPCQPRIRPTNVGLQGSPSLLQLFGDFLN